MFLKVRNQTRSTVLGDKIQVAETMWARTKGLLGRASLGEGEGLLIAPCNAIHMFFMRFAIDVAFLDDADHVVRAVHAIRPWRATRFYPKATAALELPAGTLARCLTQEGDALLLEVFDGATAPAGMEEGQGAGSAPPP
ncbi:MAG: DUF192 domain-containing protein [Myxococcales bacterium]|jgi:uncharacterized membrane protein (UPF0127 family)|nr:DUF192 domain-containing protein [Myxococcales bacterium]